ncbi:hypothetical protein C2G38_2137932, partial [Gigaspora rosea]
MPQQRFLQTSVLDNDRVRWYILGGNFDGQSTSDLNEVLYLDLSKPFNISLPPWNRDLSTIPFAVELSTACITSSSIFLIGGEMHDPISQTLYPLPPPVLKLNLTNSSWTIPNITGMNNSFLGRQTLQAVVDDTGKIFLNGGLNLTDHVVQFTGIIFGDMNILDTNTMTWSTLPIQSIPMTGYTATLINTGEILYIGGESENTPPGTLIDINQIHIFNTKSLIWSTMSTNGGDKISNRFRHTAVLTQNGTIIIFGGQSSTNYIQAPPDLVMLDTNVYPMKWRILNVSSTNAPPSLTCHSATLFDNFMIIAFGKITVASGNGYTGSAKLSSKIYVFDTLNNEWVTSTNRTSNSTNHNNKLPNIISNSQISVVIILFIVIGLIIFFTIAGALIYRKYRIYSMKEKLSESFY